MSDTIKAMTVTLNDIVSLAKRRGFFYPGSDIYGGLANTWDYDLRRATWATPLIWDVSVSRPGFGMSRTGVHRDHRLV